MGFYFPTRIFYATRDKRSFGYLEESMAMQDDENMPPPPVLKRETTQFAPSCLPLERQSPAPLITDKELLQYLQYDVTLYSCKYKDPVRTWGEILAQDYPHFKDLLAHYLPLESKTYKILSQRLKPDDKIWADKEERVYDTELYTEQQKERYLNFKCNHKGKHNGKTWRQVREDSYGYFKWSVKNAIGRDTQTFRYLVQCLRPEDIEPAKLSERKPKDFDTDLQQTTKKKKMKTDE